MVIGTPVLDNVNIGLQKKAVINRCDTMKIVFIISLKGKQGRLILPHKSLMHLLNTKGPNTEP
jgi:hypothetical protein